MLPAHREYDETIELRHPYCLLLVLCVLVGSCLLLVILSDSD